MEKLFIADFFLVLSVESFIGSGATRTSRIQVFQKFLNILLSSSVSHVFKRLLINVTEYVCGTH